MARAISTSAGSSINGDARSSGPATLISASRTSWPTSVGGGLGWIGVGCPSEAAAVWLLRAMVVSGVLGRREEAALCLPVPASDGLARQVGEAFAAVHHLWVAAGDRAGGEVLCEF